VNDFKVEGLDIIKKKDDTLEEALKEIFGFESSALLRDQLGGVTFNKELSRDIQRTYLNYTRITP
jgi:hypothetical protein